MNHMERERKRIQGRLWACKVEILESMRQNEGFLFAKTLKRRGKYGPALDELVADHIIVEYPHHYKSDPLVLHDRIDLLRKDTHIRLETPGGVRYIADFWLKGHIVGQDQDEDTRTVEITGGHRLNVGDYCEASEFSHSTRQRDFAVEVMSVDGDCLQLKFIPVND